MTCLFTNCDFLPSLLQAFVFLPLIVSLVMLFVPMSARVMNALGLSVVTLIFLGSLLLWKSFAPEYHGYAFLSSASLGLQSIGARLELGLNAFSMPMFFLASFVGCAAGFYTAQLKVDQKHLLWSFVLMILGGILGAFASIDLFYAFLFHEVALLPTLFSLMIFGGFHRRQTALEAGIFMLVGSLLMLVGLVAFKFAARLSTFSLIEWQGHLAGSLVDMSLLSSFGFVLWGAVILSGLWPFYTWVPKLLSQAPTPVAMLQGGVLKFFGLYFIFQGFLPILPEGLLDIKFLLSALCVANIVLIGFSAFAQTDLLRLIAYTAVMHMGTLFLALNAHTPEAIGGAMLAIVGSGLATALLLMMAGSLQRRTGSVEINEFAGLRQGTPRLAFFLMVGFMAVIALPCFSTFIGELAVVIGLIKAGFWSVVAVLLGLILIAGIGLRALNQLLMNSPKPQSLPDLSMTERFCAWVLVIPLVLLAFLPGILAHPLDTLLRALL